MSSHDHTSRADAEGAVQRNPHPDFSKVEASRPDWDTSSTFTFSKTKDPHWKWGSGATDAGDSLSKTHVEIDPYGANRAPVANYKLLISGIIPRPIGFLSTRSVDGTSTNLSPFSYTQVCNHDPPMFTVGFSGGLDNAKDTLKNLLDTNECVINIVSEHFVEAVNATSVNAPYGTSEWALSGLTPAGCTVVQCSRVKEAVFSIEGKLIDTKEFESRATPGKKTGVLAIIEGVRFWVREDAIDETRSLIDPAVLRPMSRLGGITYGRLVSGMEVPRPVWEKDIVGKEAEELIKPKVEGQ